MKYQVFYLMTRPSHLANLVVSLQTLRWVMPDIDVVVYSWPESLKIVERISEDERLDVRCESWIPAYTGKNGQLICKHILGMLQSADVKLYIDADTIINSDLTSLLKRAEVHGFCATQFCDWTTQVNVIQSRITKWMVGNEGFNQSNLKNLLSRPWPSVNGGIFSCRPESPILPEWNRRTKIIKDGFIPDEVALHTFVTDPIEIALTTPEACWNCSSKYPLSATPDENVKIWHFHGDCNLRPGKSPKGVQLWYPKFKWCLKNNIGGMQEWIEQDSNKYLKELIGESASLDHTTV